MKRLFSAATAFFATLAALAGSPIESDEEVVFFPGVGTRMDDATWELEIRGWIFEWERRPGVATAFRKILGISSEDLSPTERQLFEKRTGLFLIDAERGKRIRIRLADQTYELPPSDSTGHFLGKIKVADSALLRLANGSIAFEAVTDPKDTRSFTGAIRLIEPEGWSVISDIDDTIKVSHVLDRRKLLRNTFLKDFDAVPGMSTLYQRWAINESVNFHYLSASPSQLYHPLNEFIARHNFPGGSFHLRAFDWRTELQNDSGPKRHKPAVIEGLIKRFPKRQFILVGDSGESDPEIYGEIARNYPENVARILIRNVTEQSPDADRYREAFRNIARLKWQLFDSASETVSPRF